MNTRIYKKDWFLPLAIVLVAGLASIAIILVKNLSENSTNELSSGTFQYVCDASALNSIECQQLKYSDLVKNEGVKTSFVSLRAEYASDPSVKANCHQITHAIGRAAADMYGSIEGAYDNGDNFCWSGFYHGVMEQVAVVKGKNDINDSLTQICAKTSQTKRYSFYHFNCVHGLGHGLMAVNEDELFKVLELCDMFEDQWEARSCYGGAYMENIMITLQNGGQSKYLRDGEPLYPCTAVDDKYKTECYLMQTSQSLRVLDNDYNKVFELCDTTGKYQDVCYQSLGRDASGNTASDVKQTVAICTLGNSEKAQSNCVTGAVKDFISYYHGDAEAGMLCDKLPSNLRPNCKAVKESYYSTL